MVLLSSGQNLTVEVWHAQRNLYVVYTVPTTVLFLNWQTWLSRAQRMGQWMKVSYKLYFRTPMVISFISLKRYIFILLARLFHQMNQDTKKQDNEKACKIHTRSSAKMRQPKYFYFPFSRAERQKRLIHTWPWRNGGWQRTLSHLRSCTTNTIPWRWNLSAIMPCSNKNKELAEQFVKKPHSLA